MANTTDPRQSLTAVEPASRPSVYGPSQSGGGVRPQLGRSQGQIGLPGPTQPGLSRFRPPQNLPGALYGGQPPLFYFYLPSTGVAAVNPAYGAWDDVTIATRLATDIVKIASAMTTVAFSDVSTANLNILFRQWVSNTLAAQIITAQTVRIQMRADELLATNNLFLTWSIKAVSQDGGTLRGTLLSIQRDETEVDTTLTNRGDSATSAEVTTILGDRLVFEVGVGGTPTAATHTSDLRIGDAASSDLPQDDSATIDLNPWIAFQQTLIFQAVTDVTLFAAAFQQLTSSGGMVGRMYV